jgi:ABC-type multidrug transport system fused ATPase/permease subunit
MRFYAPQKGKILVNDQDIKFVTGESLRKAFSVVTQNAKLFNGTLRENVDYGKMGSSDTDVIEACKRAELNLADLVEEEAVAPEPEAENRPLAENHDSARPTAELRALDRKCGETGAKLSGGQQQRVALARALLKNGSVFLLDEPTAALDNKVSSELMRTMAEIQENKGSAAGRKTLLHITHRLEELKQADQIFYLSDGKIMERGTWAELASKDNGMFAEQVKAKAASDDYV